MYGYPLVMARQQLVRIVQTTLRASMETLWTLKAVTVSSLKRVCQIHTIKVITAIKIRCSFLTFRKTYNSFTGQWRITY